LLTDKEMAAWEYKMGGGREKAIPTKEDDGICKCKYFSGSAGGWCVTCGRQKVAGVGDVRLRPKRRFIENVKADPTPVVFNPETKGASPKIVFDIDTKDLLPGVFYKEETPKKKIRTEIARFQNLDLDEDIDE
jgi:hypothetical protein